MNDDFTDLEAELRRLRPRAPSADLRARLAAALEQAPVTSASPYRAATSWRSWKWTLWPIAAAALVALVFVGGPRRDPARSTVGPATSGSAPAKVAAANPVPAADLYKPVSAEDVLYFARDEGLVTLADGTAARRVYERYLDTYTWRNPRTNASLRWTVPRDEVRVVPVVAY